MSLRWPLLLAGFNLMLLQLLYVRELSSTLWSCELAILSVMLAYFAGLSLGYLLGERLTPPQVALGWLAAVSLHLPLIFGIRVLVGWLRSTEVTWAILPMVFLLTALLLTGFYSILLPRALVGRPESLPLSYSLELLGALVALGVAVLVPGAVSAAPLVYEASLLAIGLGLGLGRPMLVGGVLVAVVVLALLGPMDRISTLYLYGRSFPELRPWQDSRVLATRRSPYQKIEVLESPKGSRALFLNGLMYYNEADLRWYNTYVTLLPARLRPGGRVLVVGSGSLDAVARLSQSAGSITTVELDAEVAAVGQEFFHPRQELGAPWTLVIDDAKHFLATTSEQFDLIVMDVPAPFYVQTGLLCTREFYQLCRARLAPGGIVSVCLAEDFVPDRPNRAAGPILKALQGVFAAVVVVNGPESGLSFAYASDQPISEPSLREASLAVKANQIEVVAPEALSRSLQGHAPATLDDLRLVWVLNRWNLEP
ncbi:MAG: hypothetical protein AMXMBFR33_54430 [Candidatus Xenobia bacterium]